MTRSISIHLANLESPLKKSYWNTYYCANTLTQAGGKITTNYCKNRWCLVCNRIRTAVTINAYRPIIETWEDKQFVTLTIPNVSADKLSLTIEDMIKKFSNINRVIKDKKIRMKAVRKLEVTYNPERNDYHPHYHIIVDSLESAEEIKSEWLKRYPDAKHYLQNIKPCNSEFELLELFKYFTKIISNTSKKDNGRGEYKKSQSIYINALDIIFNSIVGKRTFQNYGFSLKVDVESKDEDIELDIANVEHYTWEWEQELTDWVNCETGELLTGYTPTEELVQLFEKQVFLHSKSPPLLL